MRATHTTNVAMGRDRVRLSAHLSPSGEPALVWAEHHRDGRLHGSGPSLAGIGGDLLHECEMRLASLFDGSMLWRRT